MVAVVVEEENNRNVEEQNRRTVSKNLCFLPSWFNFGLMKMHIARRESVNRNWTNLLDLCLGNRLILLEP